MIIVKSGIINKLTGFRILESLFESNQELMKILIKETRFILKFIENCMNALNEYHL